MLYEAMGQLFNKYYEVQLELSNVGNREIEKLLTDYSRHITECKAQRYQAEKLFLESNEIQSWYQERIEKRAVTGERFNVFSALGLDRKENYHSRFLAYLLDPKGHHDQGGRFLNAFLNKIGLKGVDKSEVASVSVNPEYSIGNLGRIDIVIKVPHALIAIENKVDNGEQNKQVSRYKEWLDRYPDSIEKKLVFLTPDGRSPLTGYSEVCLSYGDIESIISDFIKKGLPNPISTVLEQYSHICKFIHKGECFMTKVDDESYALLTQGDHLAVALEIAIQLELVKARIKRDFVNVVRDLLERMISEEKIVGWDVKSDPEDSFGWVSIESEGHTHKNPNFYCYIEKLFHPYNNVFGWARPVASDLKTPEQNESVLSEKMAKNSDFNVSEWWLGYKSMETRLNFQEKDIVVSVFKDNESSDHPLAVRVASTLFTCFKDWYQEIEKLPTFIDIKQKSQV